MTWFVWIGLFWLAVIFTLLWQYERISLFLYRLQLAAAVLEQHGERVTIGTITFIWSWVGVEYAAELQAFAERKRHGP